jgi:hypothetical protein
MATLIYDAETLEFTTIVELRNLLTSLEALAKSEGINLGVEISADEKSVLQISVGTEESFLRYFGPAQENERSQSWFPVSPWNGNTEPVVVHFGCVPSSFRRQDLVPYQDAFESALIYAETKLRPDVVQWTPN